MHPRRVLIADGNREAADALALLVRQMGHHVRVCYDGASALETARRLRPHAVFLDLYLPSLDGLDVARQLRAEPQFAHLLIVAITSAAGDDDRRRSSEAGIDYHLVRPVEPDYIRSLLGRRR